jgi:hypothetical protein
MKNLIDTVTSYKTEFNINGLFCADFDFVYIMDINAKTIDLLHFTQCLKDFKVDFYHDFYGDLCVRIGY